MGTPYGVRSTIRQVTWLGMSLTTHTQAQAKEQRGSGTAEGGAILGPLAPGFQRICRQTVSTNGAFVGQETPLGRGHSSIIDHNVMRWCFPGPQPATFCELPDGLQIHTYICGRCLALGTRCQISKHEELLGARRRGLVWSEYLPTPYMCNARRRRRRR